MSQSIDITPHELSIVLQVLKTALQKDSKVWVFGSRAKHSARHNSDLDLAIDAGQPLDNKTRMALQMGFEEAHLPYTVDTVDMQTVEPYFKEIIEQQQKPLPGWGKVPELRFPEFEGEWEDKALGNIAKVIDCKHRTPPYIENGIPVVSPGSIKWGALDLESPVKRVSTEEYQSLMDHCDPKVGDLVFSRNQSLGIASYISSNNPFVLGQDTVLIQSARDLSFIYYWLQRQKIQNYITSLSGGSTFSRINLSDIRQLNIKISNEDEQQKIAEFLSSMDAKLAKLSRKKTLLEDYKRGLMQQIFNQKLRFKQDDGSEFPEWELCLFSDLYSWVRTNNLSREYLTDRIGMVQNIHYGDIHTRFPALFRQSNLSIPYIENEEFTRTIQEEEYCQIGDVVIADASEDYLDIGKAIEIIQVEEHSLVAGLHTYIARPKRRLALGFSGYLMCSPDVRKSIQQIAQGVSVLGVSKTNIGLIEVKLPIYEEQQKISHFLSSIDQKIDVVAKQIEQLESFKKGLLQKLFV